jgi:hypothetical protein
MAYDELGPIVTIQLRDIRHQLSVAFGSHCDEMKAQVDAIMEETLRPENFQRVVREQIASSLVPLLQRTFEQAIHSAVYDAMRSDDVKLALAQRVADAFKKSLNRPRR